MGLWSFVACYLRPIHATVVAELVKGTSSDCYQCLMEQQQDPGWEWAYVSSILVEQGITFMCVVAVACLIVLN